MMTQETMAYDHKIRKSLKIKHLAGLDESGTGCVAGPVISACVILPDNVDLPLVKDSKKIQGLHKLRKAVNEVEKNALAISIGISTNKTVDMIGPLQADRSAMILALDKIKIEPELLLIDGAREHLLNDSIPEINKKQADSKSLTVAAASVVATYMQHMIMTNYGRIYHGYAFAENYGYLSIDGKKTLMTKGPCPIHRFRYKPVNESAQLHNLRR